MGLVGAIGRAVMKAAGAAVPGRSGSAMAVLAGRSLPARRGVREMLAAYAEMPQLRAAVSKIAHGVASTRWTVSAISSSQDGRKRYMKTGIGRIADPRSRQKAIGVYLKQGRAVEEFPDHPLPLFISNPCPLMTGVEATELTQAYMELAGESFLLLERGTGGVPIAGYPVPPHWVEETPTPSAPRFLVNANGVRQQWPMADVLWERDINPLDPYGRGSGLFSTLVDELDAGENASRLINYQFYNMNRPDILVTIDGMEEKKLEAFKSAWTGALGGIRKAFRAFFVNQPIQVQKIQSDFVHSQLGDMVRWLRDVVHQVPGIPPEILGILDNSNKATITAAEYIFAQHVLVPRLERRRAFLQSVLAPRFDARIILEYDSPVPRDLDRQLQALQASPVGSQLDDWREVMGLRPLGGRLGALWVVRPGAQLLENLEDAIGAAEKEVPEPPVPDEDVQYEGRPPAGDEVEVEEAEELPPADEKKPAKRHGGIPDLDDADLSPDGRILHDAALDAGEPPLYVARLLAILHEKDTSFSHAIYGPPSDLDMRMLDRYLAK